MPQLVLEGTWEEIKRHDLELAGMRLRVTVQYGSLPPRKPARLTVKAGERREKVLLGHAAFRDDLPSTEDFLREKQRDIDAEDRLH